MWSDQRGARACSGRQGVPLGTGACPAEHGGDRHKGVKTRLTETPCTGRDGEPTPPEVPFSQQHPVLGEGNWVISTPPKTRGAGR